jgi:predicted HAD superfamily Cof-like phosphohydrolase
MELVQSRVKEFMAFFGQKCPEKPEQLDFETAKLRANLILEEVFETITQGLGLRVYLGNKNDLTESICICEEALKEITFEYEKDKEVDLVGLADGISDISVVSYGTALAAGIDMENIDKAVAKSNLSKAWTENDLNNAKRLYPDAYIEKYSENLYRLIRKDGKIIKSPNFMKPGEEIKQEINRQLTRA